MATPTKAPRKSNKKAPSERQPDPQEQAQASTAQQEYKVNVLGYSGADLVNLMDAAVSESTTHWNGEHYKLETTSKKNLELYLGEHVSKDDDGEDPNVRLDNRIFSSVQTVTTYTTTRITEPEVYASSNAAVARKFAEDWEKALHIKAQTELLNDKINYGLEDAVIQRRGYLKPRYDGASGNFCCIDYVPCESVIVDHKAKIYEEPGHVRFLLDKSIDDLVVMFPEMKKKIYEVFKLNPDTATLVERKKKHCVFENWLFVTDEQDQLDLIVFWQYGEVCFGAIQDPNWRYGKENFFEHHMMPLISINVLNDGRSWIDKTSYVEQAKYSQRAIDERGRQIGENAGLGSIGMPVVDSAALADDQAENIVYEPDLVLELDVTNSGGQSIDDVFTTWKAEPLSPDVYKDKMDAIDAVQNAFGATAIQQGNTTDNNTLGQDQLQLGAGQGRQQKTVKAIDTATLRTYQFMSQFMLVYGGEEEMFETTGDSAPFDIIIMNSDEFDHRCQVRVKGGTSMPVDDDKRRIIADKAANNGMIDPLSYWEINDEANAQKYAKRLVDYTNDPKSFMADVTDEVFSREAYVDIYKIKHGKQPDFRDDLDKNYFDYLNQYVLSGDLENPAMPPSIARAISDFVDIQLARAQKMLGMAETQLPTPQDVAAHNQQVDEANAANAAAAKGIVPVAPAPAAPAPQDKPINSNKQTATATR
jgi:hypothetical protein